MREDRVFQCRVMLAFEISFAYRFNGVAHYLLRVPDVFIQVVNDGFDRYGIVLFVPAIVIRHERERGITNLGFARELCFLKIRHADHVHAPRAIRV